MSTQLLKVCLISTLLETLFATPTLAMPTIVTLDSGGNVGQYSSLAINSQGFPVISYVDNTTQSLKLAACKDASCSPGTLTLTTVVAGGVNFDTSLVLKQDLPIISYYDDLTRNLKLVVCQDAICQSTNPPILVDTNQNVSQSSSLVLNRQGQLVIGYYDRTNSDLKLAICTNSCNSKIIIPGNSTTSIQGEVSLTLTSQDYPIISYYDNYSGQLKLAKCTDATGNTCYSVTLDNGNSGFGDVGMYSSVKLDQDSPIVSYYDLINGDLKLAKCKDSGCSITSTQVVEAAPKSVGSHSSLAINNQGFPVISYFDDTNGHLKLARCSNATCAPPVNLIAVDGVGWVGEYTSLALNGQGQPVISYYDSTNQDLKLAIVCDTCAPPPSTEIEVRGNNIPIPSGNTLPSITDYTDFGSVMIGSSSIVHTFSIHSLGAGILNITRSVICNNNLSPDSNIFSVTAQPLSPINPAASTTFSITFTPSTLGNHFCTVNIPNDDSDENPYTFIVQGTVVNIPPPPPPPPTTTGGNNPPPTAGWSKRVPLLVWNPPSTIVYGTPLSTNQLNATADVPGSFEYTPPLGSVLETGSNQPLTLIFTPADPTQYESVTTSVVIEVTPAPLTAQVTPQTRVYGAPNPALTLTYTGWVNGLETLDVPPTLRTTATKTSTPGKYDIDCLGGSDHNYLLLCSTGQLTVLPAATTTTLFLAPAASNETIFRFTVKAINPSTAIPTGTVKILEGTTTLCQARLNSLGRGACTAAPNNLGEQTFTAVYLGHPYFQTSTSVAISYQVLQAGYHSSPPPQGTFHIGNSLVNTPITNQLLIQTAGNSPLTIDFKSLTGDNAQDFKILNSPFPVTIPEGDRELTLECTPSGEGLRTATLELSSNDPHLPNPTYFLECHGGGPGYASVPPPNTLLEMAGQILTFDLSIKEAGTEDLQVNYVGISGPQASDFQVVSPTFPFTLTNGSNLVQTVKIACHPSTEGVHTAILQLKSNDATHPLISYPLQCQKPAATPTYEGTLEFGNNVVINQPEKLNFTIPAGTLDITFNEITGAQAANFRVISPTVPFTIPAGTSQTITLECLPSYVGLHTATLAMNGSHPLLYLLQCTGIETNYISVPPPNSPLDIGNSIVGKPKTATLLINQADSSLTLKILTSQIKGSHASDFSILETPPWSGSRSLMVQCLPSEFGERKATLILATNDLAYPTVSYPLICQGLSEDLAVINDISLSNQVLVPSTSIVGQLTSSGGIPNAHYIYSILEDPSGIFQVEGDTLLLLGTTLNSPKPSYSVVIRSTEATTGVSFTKTFQLTVPSANHPPTDIELSNQVISEDGDGFVGSLRTLDADVNDTHTYTLSSGGQFVLANGNEVQVAEGIQFKRPDYLILVTSRDAGGLSITKPLTITVQPQAHFSGEIQTAKGTVESIDAPEVITVVGKIQPSSQHLHQLADIIITYRWMATESIQPLSISWPMAKQVALEEAWEMILFQGRLIGLAGTWEIELGYQIGQQYLSGPIASLEIRPNRPPQNLIWSGQSIPEESPEDTLVGKMATQDPDSQEEFTYSLIDNPGQHFKIVGDELRTSALLLDFEKQSSYKVTVRSIDLTGDFLDKTLTIHVSDGQAQLTDLQLTRTTILENSPLGTVVGRLLAVGAEIDNCEYKLLEDAQGRFKVQNDLLQVAGELDFEKQTRYSITVQGKAVNSYLAKTFTIELENEPDLGIERHDRMGRLWLKESGWSLRIIPDAKDWGQSADLLGIAQQAGQFWKLVENRWQEWDDGDLTTWASVQSVLLQKTMQVDLWQTPLSQWSGKQVQIYVGYRLKNGEIIYAEEPLEIQPKDPHP